MKVFLTALTSAILLSTPMASTAALPAPTVQESHPAPPWPTTPECDAAARLYARQRAHTNNVWDYWYGIHYAEYFDGYEPGAMGCPHV